MQTPQLTSLHRSAFPEGRVTRQEVTQTTSRDEGARHQLTASEVEHSQSHVHTRPMAQIEGYGRYSGWARAGNRLQQAGMLLTTAAIPLLVSGLRWKQSSTAPASQPDFCPPLSVNPLSEFDLYYPRNFGDFKEEIFNSTRGNLVMQFLGACANATGIVTNGRLLPGSNCTDYFALGKEYSTPPYAKPQCPVPTDPTLQCADALRAAYRQTHSNGFTFGYYDLLDQLKHLNASRTAAHQSNATSTPTSSSSQHASLNGLGIAGTVLGATGVAAFWGGALLKQWAQRMANRPVGSPSATGTAPASDGAVRPMTGVNY